MKLSQLKNRVVSSIDVNQNKIQVNISDDLNTSENASISEYANISKNEDITDKENISDATSDISKVSNIIIEPKPDFIDNVIYYKYHICVLLLAINLCIGIGYGSFSVSKSDRYEELDGLIKSNTVLIKALMNSQDNLVKTVINHMNDINALNTKTTETSVYCSNKYKKLSKAVEKQEYNLKLQFEKLDYMKVNKDEI
jgi:hypothetical protein